MTGWRIGYAAASPEIAKAMANVQSHASSNPNSIAQAATVAALEGGMAEVENMKKHFVKRRDFMVDMFNSIDGVSCRRPQGAFYIMMNIEQLIGRTMYGKTINSSDDFAALFLDVAKVAVVPGSGFGADNYVRWSYATSMDNIVEGVERLKKFLAAAEF
jgi:aspartate aminotransferase